VGEEAGLRAADDRQVHGLHRAAQPELEDIGEKYAQEESGAERLGRGAKAEAGLG
jgi:hypothetical protein